MTATMVDLHVPSKIKLNEIRHEKLRQTFHHVEAQASSILFLALQWKDIDSHFNSIRSSISQRHGQLVKLEDSLRNQLEQIKLREKRIQSVEESVDLRVKELEAREADEKTLFEKREAELLSMSVAVEERSKELEDVRAGVQLGLEALDSKEKLFRLLEQSADEKSKELESVRSLIDARFKELESREREVDLREKKQQCENNKRGKRSLADTDATDADGEAERLRKRQCRDNGGFPPSTPRAEPDNKASEGGERVLIPPDTPNAGRDKTRLRDPVLRSASLKLELLMKLIEVKICDEIKPCHSRVILDLMDRVFRFINLVIVSEDKTNAKLKARDQELRDLWCNFKSREEEFAKEKALAGDEAYQSATREAAVRFDGLEKQAFETGWTEALLVATAGLESEALMNIPVYKPTNRELHDSLPSDATTAHPNQKAQLRELERSHLQAIHESGTMHPTTIESTECLPGVVTTPLKQSSPEHTSRLSHTRGWVTKLWGTTFYWTEPSETSQYSGRMFEV